METHCPSEHTEAQPTEESVRGQEREPKQFADVLAEELIEIRKLRKKRQWNNQTPNANAEETGPDATFHAAHDHNLVGLAFSGGGIRSATFNLGVLQGLADLGLLKCFDYLSTVSGGGYIGCWLEAWIKRSQGMDSVDNGLQPKRSKRASTAPQLANKESQEIRFLREYSNYLTPRLGLLGADTWTGVTLYLGNVLLNQTILALSLGALLLLPRLGAGLLGCKALAENCVLIFALALLTVAAFVIVHQAQGLSDLADDAKLPLRTAGQAIVEWTVVTLVLIPLWLLVGWYANRFLLHQGTVAYLPGHPQDWALWVALGYCGIWLAGWVIAELLAGRPSLPSKSRRTWTRVCLRALFRVFYAAVAGAIAGLLLYCFARLFNHFFVNARVWHLAVWGLPLTVAALLIAAVFHAGLLGLLAPGTRREWWGRAAAWILIFSGTWAGINVLAIYSPIAVVWASRSTRWGAALIWLASTGLGIFAGKGSKTGLSSSKRWLDRLLPLTAYIFVLGLLIVLSFGIHWALGRATIANAEGREKIVGVAETKTSFRSFFGNEPAAVAPIANQDAKKAVAEAQTSFQAFFSKEQESAPITIQLFQTTPPVGLVTVPPASSTQRNPFQPTWNLLDASLYGLWPFPWYTSHLWPLFLWTIILLGLAWGLSRCVNINEFSMHRYYRNRLVRCYLGASRASSRRPNPFTGFDPADDLELQGLQENKGYSGPYPLINATLNLVKGKDLAWQERKAESFVFSPLFCGFDAWLERRNPTAIPGKNLADFGYRSTKTYAYPYGGVYLGTAMGISGAALSPNMGYHSSPALTFLMTVFNVRLGFWSGNPRRTDTWERPGPKVALFQLLRELFGATDDTSRYVYLSDGGHFENLGIYELVKRRCRFIIACDAGADPNLNFGDLANAIRKCRSDLGVDIKISTHPIKKDPKTGFSEEHFAIGKIHYEDADQGAESGWLIYLKSSLKRADPTDVLAYHRAHADFPHQSTVDQFFSESQFESYRMLGQHIIAELFDPLIAKSDKPAVVEEWNSYRKNRTCVAVLRDLVAKHQLH